jgi:tetratricopeptide (TPR) repeat protein
MSLSYFGIGITQHDTAAILKPNPEDRNVNPDEMAAYVNNETENVRAINRANGTLDTLRRLIANGMPVIVEIGIDPPGEYAWMGWYGHFLLVVAYDDIKEQVYVYDSWFGTSETPGANANRDGRVISYAELDRYWRQFNRSYIALYDASQQALLENIIADDLDATIMWQKALARVQAEAAAEPDNAFLWFDLGTIYNALGDYESAATAFDQARAIGLPWRMMWYQFGPYAAYYNVGRYEEVILLADLTLDYRPYFEEAFYYKALALEALGNQDEARANLQEAIAFRPSFVAAQEALTQLGPEG